MRLPSIAALGLMTLFAACDSDSGSDGGDTLEITFDGLERLSNGFHYEGWVIVDGSPVTTGKFNVGDSGALEDLSGSVIGGGLFDVGDELETATAFVLTIEPSGDSDAIPAASKYMGGDLVGGQASVSVAHGSSLGSDFTDVAGSFILATPTNGPNTDETSGIWWLDPTSGTPVPTLSLPTLPSGWEYEGWVVVGGSPVTTGRFTSASGADDFAGFSGAAAGPPFPGEDFLVNAPAGVSFPTDLSGQTAVISIEPSPDNDAAPFTLKPLVGQIPAQAAPATVYGMGANLSSVPTGSVRIR